VNDQNYLSFCGDFDGSLYRTVFGQPPELLRQGPLPVFEIPELTIDLPALGIDASQFSDVLKFSRAVHMHFGKVLVRTGGTQQENAVDFNFECSGIVIDELELEEGSENALTIKGGSGPVAIRKLTIQRSAAAHCDIELGGYSDQSWEKTECISIGEVIMTDGSPCRIRWEHAAKPTVVIGAVEWMFWESLAIRGYVWAKHFAPKAIPCLLPTLVLLAITGCSLIPSGWRIGGSPLKKEQKLEAAKAQTREKLLLGAQEASHKANLALAEVKSTERPLLLSLDFSLQAQDLLDQSLGIPPADQVAAWRNLVGRLVSDNAQIRQQAESERTADAKEIGLLSERFAQATAATQRANTRALDYAKESEGLADFARKLKLGFFGLVGLIALGTILSLVARFFPAFSLASKVVNSVVAPGITFVANRAEEGLKRIGQGMASLRTTLPGAEALIAQHFNVVTDADHQAIIAAAATAAGAGPPPTSP